MSRLTILFMKASVDFELTWNSRHNTHCPTNASDVSRAEIRPLSSVVDLTKTLLRVSLWKELKLISCLGKLIQSFHDVTMVHELDAIDHSSACLVTNDPTKYACLLLDAAAHSRQRL
jgi:hypothetical protein